MLASKSTGLIQPIAEWILILLQEHSMHSNISGPAARYS